jgi:xanthine dehydrogenase accessory factor
MDPQLLRNVADRLETGEDVVIVTVLERQGSAPATPGQKLIVSASGHIEGTVGGGQLELEAIQQARKVLGHALAPFTWHARLGPDLGLCCGGAAQMLIESHPAARRAWVVGGGHVAHALTPHLLALGYRVTVTDARAEWASADRFPGCEVLDTEADELPFVPQSRDICLIMTHDHRLDELAIAAALPQPFGFVGGVGSRAKAARIKARLAQRGMSDEFLSRLEMPVGLDIGARLPAEIAVAIAAQLVARFASPSARRRETSPACTETVPVAEPSEVGR